MKYGTSAVKETETYKGSPDLIRISNLLLTQTPQIEEPPIEKHTSVKSIGEYLVNDRWMRLPWSILVGLYQIEKGLNKRQLAENIAVLAGEPVSAMRIWRWLKGAHMPPPELKSRIIIKMKPTIEERIRKMTTSHISPFRLWEISGASKPSSKTS